MNKFFDNLKHQAEENPLVALSISVALLTAAGRFIDAAGHARGSHAYAKDVARRVKASK